MLANYVEPGTVVPALLEAIPAAIALALGDALTDRPLAPLGTRLSVAELVPLAGDLRTDLLVANEPTARWTPGGPWLDSVRPAPCPHLP